MPFSKGSPTIGLTCLFRLTGVLKYAHRMKAWEYLPTGCSTVASFIFLVTNEWNDCPEFYAVSEKGQFESRLTHCCLLNTPLLGN